MSYSHDLALEFDNDKVELMQGNVLEGTLRCQETGDKFMVRFVVTERLVHRNGKEVTVTILASSKSIPINENQDCE